MTTGHVSLDVQKCLTRFNVDNRNCTRPCNKYCTALQQRDNRRASLMAICDSNQFYEHYSAGEASICDMRQTQCMCATLRYVTLRTGVWKINIIFRPFSMETNQKSEIECLFLDHWHGFSSPTCNITRSWRNRGCLILHVASSVEFPVNPCLHLKQNLK